MAKKERKQGKGELPGLEAGYRGLYENAPVPYLSVGADGAIRRANEASAEFFGYSPDEMLTMKISDLYAEETKAKAKALLGKMKRGEGWVNEEMVYRKEDGSKVYGLLSVSPVKDEAGQVVESRSVIIDITERKQAEEALRGEKEFNENILNTAVDTVFVFDPETGKPLRWNRAFSRISGYSDKEIASMKAPDDWYDPEDLKRAAITTEKIFREGQDTVEMSLITKDGRAIPTEYTGSLVTDEEGKSRYVIAVGRDITERKQAEEALRDSEEKYRVMAETALAGIAIVDGNENISFVNEAFAGMLGYSRDEVTRMNLSQLADEENFAKFREQTKLRKKGKRSQYETSLHCRDGEVLDVIVSASPLTATDGSYVAAIGFVADIAERKRAEEELRIKNYELGERVKELNCLYGISDLVEKSGTLSQEIFQGVVNLIPPSWRYPDITCARITLENKVYSSGKFNETQWKQTADIASNGEKVGSVEVFYLEAKPEEDEGPFLREERLLLNAIAELLGRISGRKRAEEALRESENKHRVLFETMAQGVVYQDANGKIISANPAAQSILGLTLDQMQGRSSMDPRWKSIHEDGSDFPDETHPAMVALESGEPVLNIIMGVYHPQDDGWRWININAIPDFKPGKNEPFRVYTTFSDITERKQTEEQIKKSLAEKEILLDEINHRVKNNLQVLISLLGLQSAQADNEEVSRILGESANHIRTMSLVYNKLYKSEDLRNIDLGGYILDLSSDLFSIYRNRQSDINLVVNVEEVSLPVAKAIPCGLIINELLTNSFKYAFPDGASGEISIELKLSGEDEMVLIVSDSGIGFPPDFDIEKSGTLGMQLINALVRQLDASLEIVTTEGAKFLIKAPIK